MNSFFDTLKKLGPQRLAIMGAVVLGLLLFFVFVSMRVAGPKMKILYNDLAAQDSSTITAKLDELQIPYDVSVDGTKIMVSEKDVGKARMELAQAGNLPNGGNLGYEIFDKQSSFGTTNFVQNINQVRALEGELARTIGSLEPIKTARVHLVLPQRELFSRENRSASASVFIQLKGAGELDRKQIAGIQSLIASAVPNMKGKDVSIIDSQGNLLAEGGQDEDSVMSGKSEEMTRDYERRMTQTIEDLLGRTVGFGKVRATVTANLNFDRVTESAETYDPQSQVARSAQTVEEIGKEQGASDTDNVSVDNNLPNADASTGGSSGASSSNNRTEETTNYEISKVVRNTVSETGQVKKLSVAVLIDGTYTTDKDGKRTYQPRSKEELDKLKALISSAIGFDDTRGDKLELVNMQFAEIQTVDEELNTQLFGFEKGDLLDMAEILTVAIMIILVVLLVLQPMVGRLLTSAGPPIPDEEDDDLGMLPNMQAGQAQLAGPSMMDPAAYANNTAQMDAAADSMIDVQKVEGRVKASSLKKVEDIIQAYPEETVSVLRGWMSQES